MKRKIVIIILLILLFAIGIAGYFFIDGIKEDQAVTKAKSKEILASYKEFNSSIQAFATLREEYYVSRENTFLEEFSKDIKYWNDLMDKYAESIKKVENNAKDLKKNCKVKFADVNVSSSCTNFKANYEAARNYYVTDIKGYNKVVKQYNDWALENNKTSEKLKEGEFPFGEKYIDVDKDGEYFGKGEK